MCHEMTPHQIIEWAAKESIDPSGIHRMDRIFAYLLWWMTELFASSNSDTGDKPTAAGFLNHLTRFIETGKSDFPEDVIDARDAARFFSAGQR